MKTAFVVAVALGLLAAGLAACPNKCSGHGKCKADDKCDCFNHYWGPDCSYRNCKENIAWVEGTIADPHAYVECANRGVCDRATGECVCQDGFDGAGCQRLKCPNACSGHGTCEYIDALGAYVGGAWDTTKVQGCKCDGGYTGYDCSQRLCPNGDDPLTVPGSQNGQTWTVSIAHTSTLAGTGIWIIKDLWGQYESSRPFDLTSASVATAALLDTDAIKTLTSGVTVTPSGGAAGTDTYVFVLSSPAYVSDVTIDIVSCNIGGCYPMRAGATNAGTNSVTTAVTAPAAKLEAAQCSNRGLCDASSGICQCFEGYFGNSCEFQTVLA